MTVLHGLASAFVWMMMAFALSGPATAQVDPSEEILSAAETAPADPSEKTGAVARSLADWAAIYPGIPENGEIAFRITRGGSEFGRQVVRFSPRADDTLQVNVEIDLMVRAAFITFFRYEHRLEAVWDETGLVSLESVTNDNGTDHFVSVSRGAEGLDVEGSRNSASGLPLTLIPTSYWNGAIVDETEVLNTQNGEVMPVTITNKGVETIESDLGPIEATHYEMIGTLKLDLWYDASGRWVKSSFEARGETVDYILVEPGSV